MIPETGTSNDWKRAVLDYVEAVVCLCGMSHAAVEVSAWRVKHIFVLPVFTCAGCGMDIYIKPVGGRYQYYAMEFCREGVSLHEEPYLVNTDLEIR